MTFFQPNGQDRRGDTAPNAAVYLNRLRSLAPIGQKFNFAVIAIGNTSSGHYGTLKKHLYCTDPIPNQILTKDRVLKKVSAELATTSKKELGSVKLVATSSLVNYGMSF